MCILFCFRVDGILDFVPSVSKLQKSTGDDWIDRLNHLYTVILLIIFAIVVSTGQFVGDPIHCWCPAEFTDAFEAYTESYCWISNTYYIPLSDSIPIDIKTRQERELTYYQWVPLILLFQAFLFKLPNMVWKLLQGGSGINVNKVVHLSEETMLESPDDRQETIDNLARYMDKWFHTNQQYKHNIVVRVTNNVSKVCCFVCNKRAGTYLVGLFMTSKLLYLANAIGQFFMLNAFLSNDYGLFGFEVLQSLAENKPMRESPKFPRVTLCDFEIRQLQNIQRWTVQCVLPVNLFNEKIFIFIWFWLVFVAVLTFFSLVKWMFYYIFQNNKIRFVKKYLKVNNELHTGFDRKLCARFAQEYLRSDGIFVLFIVAKNASEMVVTDLIKALWLIYKEKHKPSNMLNNIEDLEPKLNDEKEPLHES